jgi:hypothetical protein
MANQNATGCQSSLMLNPSIASRIAFPIELGLFKESLSCCLQRGSFEEDKGASTAVVVHLVQISSSAGPNSTDGLIVLHRDKGTIHHLDQPHW